MTAESLRSDALRIWHAGLAAVKPGPMVRAAIEALPASIRAEIAAAPHIQVVGCGKAGAGMAAALEEVLAPQLDRIVGLVNVPEGVASTTRKIRLHPARPAGVNFPTAAGVTGAEEMLALLADAGADDVAICLISGGSSALLPAPVAGVSLEDKQAVTKLLHASGASIGEMNAVRKHLSRVKGGRLAEAFHGKRLLGLIVSDVVGDPLDVIASGPTAPDPTTFADALAVLNQYQLRSRAPASVVAHLERGAAGEITETPKSLPASMRNIIIGGNAIALAAARREAETLGYRVLDLGPFIEGETQVVASTMMGIVRNIRERSQPLAAPVCILIGGETTVSLGTSTGKGGRNQEFVLAALANLNMNSMANVAVLSAGTDGEDGPTDAAGAIATIETIQAAAALGLNAHDFLAHHDAYPFFDATGGLIRTGLTDTNVTDVRVILIR